MTNTKLLFVSDEEAERDYIVEYRYLIKNGVKYEVKSATSEGFYVIIRE